MDTLDHVRSDDVLVLCECLGVIQQTSADAAHNNANVSIANANITNNSMNDDNNMDILNNDNKPLTLKANSMNWFYK